MHPFANATQLRLDTHRPRRSFEVLTCKGSEALNQPYHFELEVLNQSGALDAHELLFSTAYLHSGASATGIHGHIQSIVRSASEPAPGKLTQVKSARYLITLGPRVGLMAYRQNQRIFQGLNAEQIITQVLSEHGIDDAGFLWQRSQPCVERDYCAQYRESDLQLLQRLCEEEGMHYYFLHTRHRHVVVFADKPEESPDNLPRIRPVDAVLDALFKTPARPKPQMSTQRACVVGGLFEAATLDARGRLKVRFDWSNQGEDARYNDCWVPVDLALTQTHSPWWGGMEVVVSFRDGNSNLPYISDRLWDPNINPGAQLDPGFTPRRVLTTRIDRDLFLDESQQFSVDDQMVVRMAQHNEMHFRVGKSLVTIDSRSISLSGLRIMLSAIAQADDAEKTP